MRPASIGPPDSTTAGRSTRASAISAAGTVLSQPTRQISASKSCAWTISSIESAITSRETSEARMPGVACDWLSETAIVLNIERDAARLLDRRGDALGQPPVVEVARHRPRPRRGDADDRPVEPVGVDAHGAEVRARARPLGPRPQRRAGAAARCVVRQVA